MRGGRVSRSGSYSGMRPRYVVGDVMMLGCGASYGWYVVVGKPEWEYSLKPGTYRLRARIENRVRSFFEQHVAQLKTLVAATGIDKAELMLSLRDFSVTSNEITIEVAAK